MIGPMPKNIVDPMANSLMIPGSTSKCLAIPAQTPPSQPLSLSRFMLVSILIPYYLVSQTWNMGLQRPFFSSTIRKYPIRVKNNAPHVEYAYGLKGGREKRVPGVVP